MAEYRAYVFGKTGQVLQRKEFDALDDDTALKSAGEHFNEGQVEVWQGDRLVGTLPQDRQS